MKRKITLPNNCLGKAILLAYIVLLIAVPFVAVLWLGLNVAPWWVAVPVATLASVVVFINAVEFKQ